MSFINMVRYNDSIWYVLWQMCAFCSSRRKCLLICARCRDHRVASGKHLLYKVLVLTRYLVCSAFPELTTRRVCNCLGNRLSCICAESPCIIALLLSYFCIPMTMNSTQKNNDVKSLFPRVPI